MPSTPPSSERLLENARGRPNIMLPTTPLQFVVSRNIAANIGHFFKPDPDGAVQFSLNADVHRTAAPLVAPPFEIVSWEFVGVHAISFRGVPATGRPVWFRGLTLIEDHGGAAPQYELRQFIDWREVLLQLGIAPEGVRPMVGQEDLDRLAQVL
ncbi:MAG: hypothetical protein QOJ19_1452 [Acidimicrobiia bacterium]|nr:hypothetical protein [Acidimicrobiia bacterium]